MTTSTATLIKKSIERLAYRKTQRTIAKEAGFTTPNMLSMIKCGKASLPIDKVPALACALEMDPALLYKTALSDLWPAHNAVIHQIFQGVLTSDEWDIVNIVRKHAGGDVPIITEALKDQITAIFDTGTGSQTAKTEA